MGDGQTAARQIGEHGLDVAGAIAAGGGIAVMADGEAALEVPRRLGIAAESVAHQAHMALGDEVAIVIGDDAGGFLAAMLQRMQAQDRQRAGIGMVENAEHAALFVQRVIVPDMVALAGHRARFPPVSTRVSQRLAVAGAIGFPGRGCALLLHRFA